MPKFPAAERLERASLRVAMHVRGLWEEKGRSDTRLLEAFFIPDDLTVVGHSREFNGKGRREHVIPRLVIIKECHRLLETGAGDDEVAKFIRDHLKIVMISDEECALLDRRATSACAKGCRAVGALVKAHSRASKPQELSGR